MKKAMNSFALTIPFVALMFAPADANNKKICMVQAAPPERPHTNPLPIASPSGTLFCPNVIVNWTQGKCEKSNLKENFCDLVELKPAKGLTFNSQRFKYKLERKQQGGKETFECVKDGEPEDVQPPVRVFDCHPDSNYIH